MKSVLVTGASGLLGKSLCRRLALSGMKVTGMTRVAGTQLESGVEPLTLDLSTNWSSKQLPLQVDTVIHLAQSSKFRDFPDSALDVFKVNVESTARLLDYAKEVGAKQFIYASSGGVYGNGAQAFSENAPIVPPGQLGYYLGSKACGEILVQSYASIFQVVVLRPFFIYGPKQNRSMLIPRLMDSVAIGKPVILTGECGIRINPVHVEDASAAVAAALDLEGSATLNIAGPDALSIRQICEAMGKHVGRRPVFDVQKGETSDLVGDISAMEKYLYKPRVRLVESFHEIQPGCSR